MLVGQMPQKKSFLSQYKCNVSMGENIKLHLMEFAQVTENREGRHKTGTLVRASTEPIF